MPSIPDQLLNHPGILAVLTGFISGFILSVPVGPVNLTIVNEGARRGLLWAALIGFGATAMEVIYCALAFTGFASMFDSKAVKAVLELTSFVFFLYLGVKFLTVSSIPSVAPMEERLKNRLHPHSAFATGFVRVMGNPGVFVFWIFLAALFRSHDFVEASVNGTACCVTGVALGTSVWFLGLSYAASCGKGKFTDRTLLLMEKGSGICLLLTAIGQGIHIIWQMTHHKL
jgi:threonine/homoserine/homoserine lactone efflux protein